MASNVSSISLAAARARRRAKVAFLLHGRKYSISLCGSRQGQALRQARPNEGFRPGRLLNRLPRIAFPASLITANRDVHPWFASDSPLEGAGFEPSVPLSVLTVSGPPFVIPPPFPASSSPKNGTTLFTAGNLGFRACSLQREAGEMQRCWVSVRCAGPIARRCAAASAARFRPCGSQANQCRIQ
jgi:hypothetical protein